VHNELLEDAWPASHPPPDYYGAKDNGLRIGTILQARDHHGTEHFAPAVAHFGHEIIYFGNSAGNVCNAVRHSCFMLHAIVRPQIIYPQKYLPQLEAWRSSIVAGVTKAGRSGGNWKIKFVKPPEGEYWWQQPDDTSCLWYSVLMVVRLA
jgi:hypothetical protein